ncbi:solute carrier family 22 member 3-like isoform X2 [Drosophila montana]|uniref:solute carrier family 22 member 3-like isoform X2 n=1 Tax=Drosophila montana TaxID=40370 RepID=UPI00313CB26A
MLEVDKMLEKCGDFNRQQLIMLLLSSLINLLSAMHFVSSSIMNTVPKHWCADGLGSGPPPPNIDECKPFYSNSSNSGTCNKYHYESYMGYQGFVSEMNWICDKEWKLKRAYNIQIAGCVLGSLVMGYLADRLGRVPILVFANVITVLGNFLTIFGVNFELFCMFRFLNGFVVNSNFSIIRILIVEYMRPSLRTVCLNICYGFFIYLGLVISPWIAILTGSWRRFILLEALPIIVVPFFYYFVPESVQWLISRQKYDKAIESLRRVAKINGRQIDDSVYEEFIEDCKLSQQNTKTNPNLLHLFRTPRLRRTFLILLFEFLVFPLYNNTVSYHVNRLGISPFVMASLSVTPLLPASLAAIILQDRIGRKASAFTIQLLMCISVLVTGVVLSPATNRSLRVLFTFYVIGAFFCYLAFNLNTLYTLELIPTCVRGQAFGALSTVGLANLLHNPYMNMRTIFLPLPEIILGVLTLLGAGLFLLLPETLNRTLPGSLEDGEQLGIDEHWYTFRCMEKRKEPEELDSSLAPRNEM